MVEAMTGSSRNAVLISGGSGLLGTSLLRSFSRDRIQSVQLIRKKADSPSTVSWDPNAAEPVQDRSRLEGLSAAIHLSGANLASHRWTAAYKREIVESRVRTTRTLVSLLKGLKRPPKSLICASATGIYGNRGEDVLTEGSVPGHGFLADTCRAWEAEADRAAEAGIRVVQLRFGVVLAIEGGALKQMLPIFRLGLGGRLGSGQQWMSWIALKDLDRAVMHTLRTDSLAGSVNLVAPIPVRNAEFTHALGRVLHRPAILPAPAFALRAAFGEMADAALLASTRAVPERLAVSGFHFEFPEIDGALRSML